MDPQVIAAYAKHAVIQAQVSFRARSLTVENVTPIEDPGKIECANSAAGSFEPLSGISCSP
jgi:hypothetical protein